eukprot:1176992-Prorocentrum_minimum.AAC.3
MPHVNFQPQLFRLATVRTSGVREHTPSPTLLRILSARHPNQMLDGVKPQSLGFSKQTIVRRADCEGGSSRYLIIRMPWRRGSRALSNYAVATLPRRHLVGIVVGSGGTLSAL